VAIHADAALIGFYRLRPNHPSLLFSVLQEYEGQPELDRK
jgi:hypothetical protein